MLPTGSLKQITKVDKELADALGEYKNNPYGFVKFAYHWGEGELAGQDGPDVWQTEFLKRLGEELDKRESEDINEIIRTSVRMAVASGHGVGKTAMVAWIVHWFITTRPNSSIIVTANTAAQLSTKTWRELAKWHRRLINRHWFQWTATKFYHVLQPETWFAAAIPWSKDNSDAFAGTHEDRGVLVIFDEASSIDDIIWDVVQGAMTTHGAVWIAFGNPTKNEGSFYDCFQKNSRWINYQVDSRKAKVANISELEAWIEEYGEDSDFVRVRILGQFPRLSENQFISADVVVEASRRRVDLSSQQHIRAIIGVDVAGFGGDQSIIQVRQGNYAYPAQKFREIDTMELSGLIVDTYRRFGSNAVVCVDGVGMGAGVVDRLNQLGLTVIDVQSASKPMDARTYCNKRAELWGKMKDWLLTGGAIPSDKELIDQLCSLQYGLNKRLQIQLQSKLELRKTKGSPDVADALAYTFAYDEMQSLSRSSRKRPVQQVIWL